MSANQRWKLPTVGLTPIKAQSLELEQIIHVVQSITISISVVYASIDIIHTDGCVCLYWISRFLINGICFSFSDPHPTLFMRTHLVFVLDISRYIDTYILELDPLRLLIWKWTSMMLSRIWGLGISVWLAFLGTRTLKSLLP